MNFLRLLFAFIVIPGTLFPQSTLRSFLEELQQLIISKLQNYSAKEKKRIKKYLANFSKIQGGAAL